MRTKLPEEIKVKPKLAEIINHMEVGDQVRFEAKKHGALTAARSAVSRANSRLGATEYRVFSNDNGVTYMVTREAPIHQDCE